MGSKWINIEEAGSITRCAFVTQNIRHKDLFAVLEVAIEEIMKLKERVKELENIKLISKI